MKALLWILGLGLLGCGALWLAWRLVPTEAREGARPEQRPEAVPARDAARPGALVEQGATTRAAREPLAEPDAPPPAELPPPDGLEEGGAARAARPLPDFAPKYEGQTRALLRVARYELEETIRAARAELDAAQVEDLGLRLVNRPRPRPPSEEVAALLALIDERDWLVQRLALPAAEDP